MTKPYFPLFIDLSQKRVVVVGGGKIAARRVEALLDFAEDIHVVAPEVTERLQRLDEEGRIRWTAEVYQEEVLRGAELVLAATDDAACNEKVIEDCRIRKIPANASHRKEWCDFYFPGIIKEGNLVVGFCSSGLSHREVREAREKVEQALSGKQLPDTERGLEDRQPCGKHGDSLSSGTC